MMSSLPLLTETAAADYTASGNERAKLAR